MSQHEWINSLSQVELEEYAKKLEQDNVELIELFNAGEISKDILYKQTKHLYDEWCFVFDKTNNKIEN